ncbi:MAG TPA: ADP-ribosylglycohydrolase family protein, partial [Verrucomicrobiae bacterium]|nr:ADP-ribosylglycohydrolase family protein [Verrucomicrobiae bacterium]
SYGNGAAMRVTPIALAFYDDLFEMLEVVRLSALITHAHKLGIEGAALQALSVALLLREPSDVRVSGTAFVDLLISYVNDASESLYVHKLKEIKELLPDARPLDVARRLGNGIEAHQAVPAALCSFLKHPTSLPEALRFAISLGGDTDTIASMTGALSGAYLGESAIPLYWLKKLEAADRIAHLADALLDLTLGRRKQAGSAV